MLFVIKMSLGYYLGFGLGDFLFYILIDGIFLITFIYAVLLIGKRVKSNYVFELIIIFLLVYNLYILTFGEGPEGIGWCY